MYISDPRSKINFRNLIEYFISQIHQTNTSVEQVCVGYYCQKDGFLIGFESCICPDEKQLEEFVEQETNAKGKNNVLLSQ